MQKNDNNNKFYVFGFTIFGSMLLMVISVVFFIFGINSIHSFNNIFEVLGLIMYGGFIVLFLFYFIADYQYGTVAFSGDEIRVYYFTHKLRSVFQWNDVKEVGIGRSPRGALSTYIYISKFPVPQKDLGRIYETYKKNKDIILICFSENKYDIVEKYYGGEILHEEIIASYPKHRIRNAELAEKIKEKKMSFKTKIYQTYLNEPKTKAILILILFGTGMASIQIALYIIRRARIIDEMGSFGYYFVLLAVTAIILFYLYIFVRNAFNRKLKISKSVIEITMYFGRSLAKIDWKEVTEIGITENRKGKFIIYISKFKVPEEHRQNIVYKYKKNEDIIVVDYSIILYNAIKQKYRDSIIGEDTILK